jgi:predicted S18 family serine protease
MLNGAILAGIHHQVSQTSHKVNTLEQRVGYVESDLKAASNGSIAANGVFSNSHNVTAGLPLYETRTNSGVVVRFSVTNVPGTGVYFRANEVTYGGTMQKSVQETSRYIYSANESYQPSYRATYLRINAESEWNGINGASLELPFALSLAATPLDRDLNESVIATGELDEQGNIKTVAEVPAKARAAKEAGYDIFLVPENTQRIRVDGIKIIRVATFEDAAEIAIENRSNRK